MKLIEALRPFMLCPLGVCLAYQNSQYVNCLEWDVALE